MDIFTIYLPIAGIHFNVLILLLIGFTVGVCGGFFGIGGAWIVTPALNIFGFPMPYAIGTDLAHIGGKSIVSTIRHGKFGNVDVRLGVAMILGTTIGMELGANLVMVLERIGLAETVIRKAYIVFLALIGAYVLYDYISHTRRQRQVAATGSAPSGGMTVAQRLQRIRIPPMIHFPASGITCSMWLPLLVGLTTGIVASVLGVGGGFIRMPALIYLVGCPTAVAVGTDLFEVMVTGAYGAFTYGVKGRVELIAAMWMLAAAAVGAQLGTVAVKYVRGYSIRLLFAITIFIACASVLLKQLQFQLASSITILIAGVGISGVIIGLLVKGIKDEKAGQSNGPWGSGGGRGVRRAGTMAFMLVALLVVVSCLSPVVVQGTVTSVDGATDVMIVQDENPPHQQLSFDISEAEMGAPPAVGDVVRVAYHEREDGRLVAGRLMNLTRQSELSATRQH